MSKNKDIVDRLNNFKELLHEMNVSTEQLSEEIDSIIDDISGTSEHNIDDPFAVDDNLDNFMNESNDSFGISSDF